MRGQAQAHPPCAAPHSTTQADVSAAYPPDALTRAPTALAASAITEPLAKVSCQDVSKGRASGRMTTSKSGHWPDSSNSHPCNR